MYMRYMLLHTYYFVKYITRNRQKKDNMNGCELNLSKSLVAKGTKKRANHNFCDLLLI